MAKSFDLSGLKKSPLKKKSNASPKKEDLIVDAIHQEEEVVKPPKRITKKVIKKPVIQKKESVKRVTLDLPASLHTKLKMYAVTNETTIRRVVIELLEQVLD